MSWTRKHLLDLASLTAEEITTILDLAGRFKEVHTRSVRTVPALRGKTVVNLFYESSTRTANAFAIAAKRLSADGISFTSAGSSTNKGESLVDTARNIEAMGVDVFVVRHSAPGAPALIARSVKASVINAGDGAHEHPSQGLLDIFTMREKKGLLQGLRVALVGDIAHSRVARSNIHGLLKLGAQVTVCGPPTLVPREMADMGVTVSHDLDRVIEQAQVLNVLRIQFERQGTRTFPSIREYTMLFGITRERMRRARPNVLVMHPGPINRGVELAPSVADGPHSVILEQVTNGVAVRMAILYLVAGPREKKTRKTKTKGATLFDGMDPA